MPSSSQPAYRAFTVVKREGQDDYWLPIGAAWRHSENGGDGLNIVLQALPIPGPDGVCKIVLRPPKEDDEQAKQTIREANDRRRGR
jgi:hypothetical protein